MCRHCSCCLVLPLTIQFEDHFCQIGAKLLNLRIIFTKMNQHGAKWSKIIEVGDNFYTIIVVNRSINILTCFQCQLIVELLLNREKQYDHIFKSFQVLNGFRWHRAAWFNEFILFNVQQSKIKWMKRVKEENRFFLYLYRRPWYRWKGHRKHICVSKKYILCKAGQSQMYVVSIDRKYKNIANTKHVLQYVFSGPTSVAMEISEE